MSRSHRHNPVIQMCSHTQKEWKRTYNRILRHHNKIRVRRGDEPLSVRDVSDIWSSPSDGWISYWDQWSERLKQNSWWWRYSTPEKDAAWDERLKRRVFNK